MAPSTADDEREYLELKLKYVQSVGTVFRQKVSILLHDLLEGRLSHDDRTGAIHDLMYEMERMDSPRTNAGEGDASEYWRDRFLQSLEDARPSSLQEAQTLCGLLQERSELQLALKALRQRHDALDAELQKMKENYIRVLDSKAMTADEALLEKFKLKEAELFRLNPASGTSNTTTEVERLRAEQAKMEQKMKLVRLRHEQQRKELDEARAQIVTLQDEHTRQLEGLISGANDLRAKFAVRDAEARRAESDRASAERTVVLKDHTIVRLEARVAALEKEVEAALKEGTANVTTTETAILRRQIDSFELKIRQLESALADRTKSVVALEEEAATLRSTIAAKQLVIDSKTKLADSLMKRLENCAKDEQQKEAHTAMLTHLEERMLAALQEVAARQNPTDLTQNVSTLNAHVTTIESIKKTLDLKEAELAKVQAELAAYKAELTRCVRLQRVPAVDTVEAEVVKARLLAISGDDGAGPNVGTAEVLLRRNGPWSEVRERSTGKVYYTTTDGSLTPFKPTKVKPYVPPEPAPTVTVEAPPSRDKTPRSTLDADAPPSRDKTPRTTLDATDALSGSRGATPRRMSHLEAEGQEEQQSPTIAKVVGGRGMEDASPDTESELASPF